MSEVPADVRGLEDARWDQRIVDVRVICLFVRMWALAHVVHLVGFTDSALDSPWNITVVGAALFLLLHPDDGRVLALMALAQLCDLVAEMPFSPDHWMLLAFVNLILLATMAATRSTDIRKLGRAFPGIRVVVLIAYSAAALAKYNTTFLEPVTSCATAIASTASFGLTRELGATPIWAFSVLATETAIPLLLAVPATRRHGVRIALAFHFFLSASPTFAVVDFTAALFAVFLLFLPESEVCRVLDTLAAAARRSAVVRDARRWPWATAIVALVAFGFSGYLSARVGASLVFLASEIYLLAVLLACLLTWRKGSGRRPFGRPMLVHLPVFAALLVWVALPYLGFRTTSVFTMFSGLRTEGDVGNHLFMPTIRATDWQEEFVVIESSNDPALEAAEDGRAGVPLMALRRLAMDDPDLVVVGMLDGERITFGPEPGQRHLEELSYWEYKFLHFRPVAASDRPFCSNS